jgi:hypothetical protein
MIDFFNVTTITDFTNLVSFLNGGVLFDFVRQGQDLLNIVMFNGGLSDVRFINESLWTCSSLPGTWDVVSGFINSPDPVVYLQSQNADSIYRLQSFVKSAITENGYMKMLIAQISNIFA